MLFLFLCLVALVWSLDIDNVVVRLDRASLSLSDPKQEARTLKAVEFLANNIAHSQRNIVTEWSTTPTPFSCPRTLSCCIIDMSIRLMEQNPPTERLEYFEHMRLSESYSLTISYPQSKNPHVVLVGRSHRGLLYAISALIRDYFTISYLDQPYLGIIEGAVSITATPSFAIRSQRIGYNNLDNTVDAWTVQQMDTYIQNMILFNANQVDIGSPDGEFSPHFHLPPQQMNEEISKICDLYDIRMSLYYPVNTKQHWGPFWQNMSRIDMLWIPSGDSGGGSDLKPKTLIDFLTAHLPAFFKIYPATEVWMTDQIWNEDDLKSLYHILQTQPPAWLTGIAYGPHTRDTINQTRAYIPAHMPLLHYPDIAHQLKAEFPQPEWSFIFAFTLARESINPRPTQMKNIFTLTQAEPNMVGFSTYDEGMTSDINIMLWSSLGWNTTADVDSFLLSYAKSFIFGDDPLSNIVVNVIKQLEEHWHGDPAHNKIIEKSLAEAKLLRVSTPNYYWVKNWRLQSLVFRAYYDAYQQLRFLYEAEAERASLDTLKLAPSLGSREAMRIATELLEKAQKNQPELLRSYRSEIFALGKLLYDSIGLQMSVPLYQAAGIGRGACLDTIDVPLNNIRYLLQQFSIITRLPSEGQRLAALQTIVNWSDPGPGGFYDNLGNIGEQPHLLPGQGSSIDPSYYFSSLSSFQEPFNVSEVTIYPFTWYTWAESFYNQPLKMFYPSLSSFSAYQLQLVYPTEEAGNQIRLLAYSSSGTSYLIHDYMPKPNPMKILSFNLPGELTKGGSLLLSWTDLPLGQGGNGRGTQVAEVWLRKL